VKETWEMEKIPSEKAVEMLQEGGLEVSAEQAKIILEFLYKLANIAVAQYLMKPP
jgi:hypothetical protein